MSEVCWWPIVGTYDPSILGKKCRLNYKNATDFAFVPVAMKIDAISNGTNPLAHDAERFATVPYIKRVPRKPVR
jgi:hypothetical protein